jgi:hypothetical protein
VNPLALNFGANVSKLTEFVAELARSIGMDELTPDDEGVYAIVFDGNLEIEVFPMGQSRFLLRYKLPAVPADDEERTSLLKSCLQRSLAYLRESPAAVTFDSASNRLWLYRAADAGALDARSGLELLEGFVNLAEMWSRFTPEPKSTGFGAMPFNMMMRP